MQELFPSPSAGRFGRRQKRERGARIPVTVVTGFLGAGKTTLVRHFLETPEGHGTAVLVNEFGEAGIDDALLRNSTEKTVLLGNGCLCCNFRSDLQVALHRLVVDRERGVIPHFGRIVIETSGLADPSPILTTFATDRALGGEFFVEAVIAVIAAADGIKTVAKFAEARRQIMLADRIVISKTDIADDDAVDALTGRLRELNPRARVIAADYGRLDPGWIADAASARDGAAFLAEAAEVEHTDKVRSFTLTENAPIAWEPFARAMETLIALRGADLLRAKGLINVAGCKGPVVVQFVQHIAHPPVELAAWPDGERTSRIVFITRDLGEREVKDLLAAVRAVAKA
ncbi:MAG TPA: GTP-binding protein [Xanthobacteraceae bacterium]|nr:GTP-binding protein [Xanthobacteraceae bacterium]